MTRFLLSAVAAAALLAPVAASAATTMHKPMAHKTAMHKPMGKKGMKTAAARSRDGGSAAVDALNEQSLARARGAQ